VTRLLVDAGEVKIVDEFTVEPSTVDVGPTAYTKRSKPRNACASKRRTTRGHGHLQNYFRMYEKLAGMTGTAETEAAEFAHLQALRRADSFEQPLVRSTSPTSSTRPRTQVRRDRRDVRERSDLGSRFCSVRRRSRSPSCSLVNSPKPESLTKS